MEKQYIVNGMRCAGCSTRVEKKVRSLAGVSAASVNLLAKTLTVTWKDEPADAELVKAVTALGFKVELPETAQPERNEPAAPPTGATAPPSAPQPTAPRRWALPATLFLWLAIALLMVWRMAFGGPSVPIGLVQLALTLVVFGINIRLFVRGFRSLATAPDMDSLVALGCTASFLLSLMGLALGYRHVYFESAAMILAIVTFGRHLEEKAKRRASRALDKLRSLAPDTVLKLEDGEEIPTPVAQIRHGDRLLVKPGMRLSLDGVILSGTSSVDESSLTGESIPRDVFPGDTVYGGTMNLTGAIQLEVTKTGQDTLLSGIIKLVTQSALTRSKAVRLADALAARFVPIVGSIALLTGVLWIAHGASLELAATYAISVLVVSCPCALGLATPVAVTVALSRAARRGVLFKSGEALEKLSRVTHLFLDKTGTITTGQPRVTDVIGKEAEVLSTALGLETNSKHPVANAVVAHCAEKGIAADAAQDCFGQFREVPGKGLQSAGAAIGTLPFLRALDVTLPDEVRQQADALAADGKTVLAVARPPRYLGLIAVRDGIAPGSPKAIQDFRRLGLALTMLSGDSQPTANAIGREAGLDDARGGLLPADKAAVLDDARKAGHSTAMVGDGINDAPALTHADVGIAIGAGADIALECADVLAMNSRLDDVAVAVTIARHAVRTIRQNLFWAFCYNLIAIPVAAGALSTWGITLNPMIAAIAMSLSSICVVTNSIRPAFNSHRK